MAGRPKRPELQRKDLSLLRKIKEAEGALRPSELLDDGTDILAKVRSQPGLARGQAWCNGAGL